MGRLVLIPILTKRNQLSLGHLDDLLFVLILDTVNPVLK
jgi:hypothetical protein